MSNYDIEQHEDLKAISKKIQTQKSELDDLKKQLSELSEQLPTLEQKIYNAKADLAMDIGSQEAVDEAKAAYQKAKEQVNCLQEDVRTHQQIIGRLESKHEEVRSRIVSEIEDEAKAEYDQLVQEMIEAFQLFAEKAEEVKAFESSLPSEVTVGAMGLTRRELHSRNAPKLPWIMDKARKRGYKIFETD